MYHSTPASHIQLINNTYDPFAFPSAHHLVCTLVPSTRSFSNDIIPLVLLNEFWQTMTKLWGGKKGMLHDLISCFRSPKSMKGAPQKSLKGSEWNMTLMLNPAVPSLFFYTLETGCCHCEAGMKSQLSSTSFVHWVHVHRQPNQRWQWLGLSVARAWWNQMK